VRFLIAEYRHFLEDPRALKERLRGLTSRHGHAVIERWLALTDAGSWEELVADLLATHYDPSYLRATARNYSHYDDGIRLSIERLDEPGTRNAVAELARSAA
jgi:tRNA 2-selenouridine synthase